MQLIIISGPSGSGKTTLSEIIFKRFKNGIILNTDNYYKTGLKSLILSKIIPSYFDRLISFNYKLFKKDLDFVLKNGSSNFFYEYNFKNRSIKKINKITKNIRLVIVEGIFAHEIIGSLGDENSILINLKINKNLCMKRVIKRDNEERGKNKLLAKRDFIKAWELFFNKKNKNKKRKNNNFKKYTIENKSDLNTLLRYLTNIVN